MRCSIVSRLSLLPRRVGNSGASARRRVRRASPAGRRSCRWSRGDPVFASFAVAGDVCARPEVDVTAGEPCQFGGPQPSLHGECQQRVVTPPGPARQVAAGEQRVNLGLGEVVINARSKPSSRGKTSSLSDGHVVKRNDDATGFEALPRRWVVERTFAWISKHRRCVRDYVTHPLPRSHRLRRNNHDHVTTT